MPFFSLSGKRTNTYSTLHLSGSHSTNTNQNIPLEVKKLKTMIMSHVFLPLISKQWPTLRQNIFFLDKMKQKLKYYQSFPALIEDLQLYSDLLNMLETVLNEHNQLEEIERKVYSNGGGSVKITGEASEVTSLIYKTTTIRLKPEYEIYNILFGKPQREKNHTYRIEIIEDIQKMLGLENITFEKIKEVILQKYENEKDD